MGHMPQNLRRYHESGQSHFVTFSCYHRRPKFASADAYDLFPVCLEEMRRRFRMRVYGYIVMPEHVHLLLSEPEESTLADAIHFLKLSFSKRVKLWTQVSVQQKDANLGHQRRNEHDDQSADRQHHEPFWQKALLRPQRRTVPEFSIKLRYLHRNPVKRGLVKEAADW